MIKAIRNILVCITLSCALAAAAQGQSSLTLPTPRDHYKNYNVERAGLELMEKAIKDFEPPILKVVQLLDSGAQTEHLPPTGSEELLHLGRAARLELLAKVLSGFGPETRKRVAKSLRS